MTDTLYEYYNTGNDTIHSMHATSWMFQTFTVGTVGSNQNHSVTSIKLLLYRYQTPGTVTVSIRAVGVDGKPTGTDVTSGTTNGNTLPTSSASAEWREIFLAPYTLSANTKYALVVRPSEAYPNRLYWLTDDSLSTYTGGDLGAGDGVTWNVYLTCDGMFEEYGIPVASGICQWITAKGGAIGLDISEVFQIIDSFLFNTPPTGYTFIPTIIQVMGIIDYYLGFISSGNQNTGCSF